MTDQVWLKANLVRLQKAVLCADCEVISEGVNGRCECCGSQSLLGLSPILGGTIAAEMPFAMAAPAPAVNHKVRVFNRKAA